MITNEIDIYVGEILEQPKVSSILTSAKNHGISNIMLKNKIPGSSKLTIDKYEMTISDSLITKNDLILILEKNDCHSGTFILTANPKNTFSIEGKFFKINKKWKTKILKNVEI